MKIESNLSSPKRGDKFLKAAIAATIKPTSPTTNNTIKHKYKAGFQKTLKHKTAKHAASLLFHPKNRTLEQKERDPKPLHASLFFMNSRTSGKKLTGKNLQRKMTNSGIATFDATKSSFSLLGLEKNCNSYPNKTLPHQPKERRQKLATNHLEKESIDEMIAEPLSENNLNIPFANPNLKFNKNPLLRQPKLVEVLESSETNSCNTPDIFNISIQKTKDSPNLTDSHDNEEDTLFNMNSSTLKGNQAKDLKSSRLQAQGNKSSYQPISIRMPVTLNKFFTSIGRTKENFIQQTVKAFEAAKTVSKNLSKIGILVEYRLPDSKLSNYFLDASTFRLISEFFCIESLSQISGVCKIFRSQELSSLIKNRKTELILKGLSSKDVFILWNDYIKFPYLESKYPFIYQNNLAKESHFIRDIQNDIDRTRFLDLDDNLKKERLTKVLVASSNSLPKIGYVQGLNSIVSILLSQGLTEQQSYWMLLYLLKRCKINELLAEGFPKVQVLNYQLEIYMRNYLPDVIDYLGESGFNISYFTTQWFITLFTYELEFDQIITLWSLYLVKGWKTLIRISLALIFLFKKDILNTNSDELPNYLKSFVRENTDRLNTKELFKVTLSFKVTNRLLKVLEILHEHSSPSHVILTAQPNAKLDWKILPEDFTSAAADPSVIQADVMEYLNAEFTDSVINRKNETFLKEINDEENKNKDDLHSQDLSATLDLGRISNQHNFTESMNSERITAGASAANLFENKRKKLNNSAGGKTGRVNLEVRETIPEESDTDSNLLIQTLTNLGRQIKQFLNAKEDQASSTSLNDIDMCLQRGPKASEKAHFLGRSSNPIFGKTTCIKDPASFPFRKSVLNLLNENDKSRMSIVTHVPPPSILSLGEPYSSNPASEKHLKELNFPVITREYQAPTENSPRISPKIIKMNLENICNVFFESTGTKDKRLQNPAIRAKEDQENIVTQIDAPILDVKQLNTKPRYSKVNLDMDYKKIFSLIDNQLSHSQLPSKMH